MSKLKPCPFCGGAAGFNEHDDDSFYATCRNHMCDVDAQTVNHKTKADALSIWNTRAAPTMKAWEWVESNAHGPAWKCDTFKALTYLAAGEWHVYIDLIFVGSVVASVQDAPELAKAIGVAYVERKLKEWIL